jgi:hypothetical protein
MSGHLVFMVFRLGILWLFRFRVLWIRLIMDFGLFNSLILAYANRAQISQLSGDYFDWVDFYWV